MLSRRLAGPLTRKARVLWANAGSPARQRGRHSLAAFALGSGFLGSAALCQEGGGNAPLLPAASTDVLSEAQMRAMPECCREMRSQLVWGESAHIADEAYLQMFYIACSYWRHMCPEDIPKVKAIHPVP